MASRVVFAVFRIALCYAVIEARDRAEAVENLTGPIHDLMENGIDENPYNTVDDEQTKRIDITDERSGKIRKTDDITQELDDVLPLKELDQPISVVTTSTSPKGKRRACDPARCGKLKAARRAEASRQRELLQAWNNQLVVVQKIVEHMENVARQGKSEFDQLLEDMKTKRTTQKWKTETTATTSMPPPTQLTLVDETEVRRALKRDPLVRRILEMARMKREEFFRGLKKNNISLSQLTWKSISQITLEMASLTLSYSQHAVHVALGTSPYNPLSGSVTEFPSYLRSPRSNTNEINTGPHGKHQLSIKKRIIKIDSLNRKF
ncbi:unnamed protein product, partial [Iphiclides podalirius]